MRTLWLEVTSVFWSHIANEWQYWHPNPVLTPKPMIFPVSGIYYKTGALDFIKFINWWFIEVVYSECNLVLLLFYFPLLKYMPPHQWVPSGRVNTLSCSHRPHHSLLLTPTHFLYLCGPRTLNLKPQWSRPNLSSCIWGAEIVSGLISHRNNDDKRH